MDVGIVAYILIILRRSADIHAVILAKADCTISKIIIGTELDLRVDLPIAINAYVIYAAGVLVLKRTRI